MVKSEVWLDLDDVVVSEIVLRAEAHLAAHLQARIIDAAIAAVAPAAHKNRPEDDWPGRLSYLDAIQEEADAWRQHVEPIASVRLPANATPIPPQWGSPILTIECERVRLGLGPDFRVWKIGIQIR
jgi:hypothetical protein